MWTLPCPIPRYFLMPKILAFKYTRYGTSVHVETINLQYFAVLLDSNV